MMKCFLVPACSRTLLPAILLCSAAAACAQKKPPPPPAGTKATIVRAEAIHVQGDETADRVGTVTPGRELIIVEHSGKWLRVFANTDTEIVREQDVPVFSNEQAQPSVSGWILDRGVVASDTPNGDAILFGEAVSTEQSASEPHAPAHAAEDARRLYRMVTELFPQSPRAPEAAWRAADIRWQLQKEDAATLPSAHEKENYLRQLPDESEMKKIEKLYPTSKWAAYAAFELIENKLCGDWQGSEKCPEKEAGYYAKYAEDHPDSPRAAEALYKAAFRLASAADMWTADGEEKRSEKDRADANGLAAACASKYAQTEYAARAAGLIYKMQQQIPIYGSDRE